jgi:hypothetical protein
MSIAVLLVSGASMYADVVVNFDENGVGDFNGTPFAACGGGVTTGCWQMVGANPTIGFSGYLTYFFPAGIRVKNGDVKILEPGTTLWSDGLRFTNASGKLNGNTADRMFVFSDQIDGIDAKADTGFPSNFYSKGNRLTLEETGPPPGCGPFSEKFNGVCYSPATDQPGGHLLGMGSMHTVHYNFTSDAPESGVPIELALGPCGVLLCGIILRKRLVSN